jgi:hypothetical protein
MNDDPRDETTTPPEDELVSAALDGEASDEERSRITADARLVDRSASFQRVSAAVADIGAVDRAQRDAVIARALAAADDEASAPVVDLGRARRRRIALIVAAAAIVVIAIPLLVLTVNRDKPEKLASTGAAVESASPSVNAPASTTTTPTVAPDMAAASPLHAGDLGALANTDELRSAVQAALAENLDQSRTALGAATPDCAAQVAAGAEGSVAALAASATYQGQPAEVVALRLPGAPGVVIVVSRPDCTEIARTTG